MALKPPSSRFVERASVYVIASQNLEAGLGDFLDDEGYGWTPESPNPGQADVLCEVAGRVCYMSFDGGRPHAEYLRHIKESKHGSIFEHSVLTFLLAGVSRSLTHELVRHRAGWSYSQLSQRYVDEKHARFVVPPNLRGKPEMRARWEQDTLQAFAAYLEFQAWLREVYGDGPSGRKVVNGTARSLLPNCTETKIVCTVNARAFRHFLEQRASVAADDEIRELALAMYRAAKPYWREILADYTEMSEDGRVVLSTSYTKV